MSGARPRTRAAGVALLLTAAPIAARAQASDEGEPRGAFAFGAGAGGPLAGAASGCGTTFAASASAGVRWRAWRAVILDASTTIASGVSTNDCLYLGHPQPDGSFRRAVYVDDPDEGTTAPALRVGLEGGSRWARARVLAGVGRMLQQGVTFRTAGVSGSVGPRAIRFRVDVERWWYALPVQVVRVGFVDGRTTETPLGGDRLDERSTATRVGFDIPFGPRR